jgi:eukaryotic-like serine/threonine-protein kinase
MALTSGTKLGPYEIVSPLGAGGMGEVYRARDTRLERDVAVKVLPANLSSDPNLRQRLEREAKAVSKLSHPHICTLHDIGHQDGIDYLVMELVEGETLEQRLTKGPLPPEQTIRYSAQIADALAKAHKLGFTHRDLKPANIMLTKMGAKLMDFGLAKQAESAPLAQALTKVTMEQSRLTGEGTIVGTFQYMAPEQLEGKEAGPRTDIFALGEVMFEMATGKPAFSGKSRASLIAAILTNDPPPITQLQPMTPPALERVVKKCLAKDPDDRWQSASDLASELNWILEGGSQTGVPARVTGHQNTRERVAWGLTVALLGALAWFAIGYLRHEPKPEHTSRVSIIVPQDLFIDPFSATLSPDGRQVAFVATPPQGKQQLWVRLLSSLSQQPLAGTENAYTPFWSPDSHRLAFFADGKLKRIDSGGGSVSTLADAPNGRGGAWSPDGVIVFAPNMSEVLYRVPASGGLATRLTSFSTVPGNTHRWPCFLPDGRHFLFLARGQTQGPVAATEQTGSYAGIYSGSLDSGETKLLLRTSRRALFVQPGYLLFLRGVNLVGQRFDSKHLEVQGEPSIIAEHVQEDDRFGGAFSASANGSLLYAMGSGAGAALTWYSPNGKSGDTVVQATFNVARLSPDGRKVAASLMDEETGTLQMWIYDLERKTESRFSFDPADHDDPVWSPDGKNIAFDSVKGNSYQIYRKRADGSQPEELLWEDEAGTYPTSWSPDANYVAYDKLEKGQSQYDIWILPLSGERKPFPYLHSEASEQFADFSPDLKWIAYASNASSKEQVYVATFPDAHARFQVSTSGGSNPKWRRDGKELYYMDADHNIVAVSVTTRGHTVELGSARALFRVTGISPGYALNVTDDGQHFLIVHYVGLSSSSFTLVMDWAAELKP